MRSMPRPHQGARVSPELVVVAARIVDVLLVLFAALSSLKLAQSYGIRFATETSNYTLTGVVGALLFGAFSHQVGGYDFKSLRRWGWQIGQVLICLQLSSSVLLSLAFFVKVSTDFSRGWAFAWAIETTVLLILWRLILARLIDHWTQRGHLVRQLVIIGANHQGARLIERMRAATDRSVALIGLFDDRLTRVPKTIEGVEVSGTVDDLLLLARHTRIDEVIVALPLTAEHRLKTIFDRLRLLPIDLRLDATPLTTAFPVRGLSYVGEAPTLDIFDRPLKHWNGVIKRLEDVTIASMLLLIQLPMLALIALAIKLDSPGPVLFVQDRFGYSNRTIKVWKFRTMYADFGDLSGGLRTVRNDPRVTRVGRFLRVWSIDELPQLFNVLRGDMSIVGPRPHAIAMRAGDQLYHDAVEEYLHRHKVRPGITGWAQVNGLRGEIDSLEKARARVRFDLEYIEHWSLWFDLKIILMTFRTLLTRQNAY